MVAGRVHWCVRAGDSLIVAVEGYVSDAPGAEVLVSMVEALLRLSCESEKRVYYYRQLYEPIGDPRTYMMEVADVAPGRLLLDLAPTEDYIPWIRYEIRASSETAELGG